MTNDDRSNAVQKYVDAAEALYRSLGIAVHDEGGMVAFVTPQTIDRINDFHVASMRLAGVCKKGEQ